MGKGVNTDNPRGFVYEKRLGDEAPPVLFLETLVGTIGAISAGDPVKIHTDGYAVKAASGDVIVGVAIGDAAQINIGDGDGMKPGVLVNAALPDVIFRVQDSAATSVVASKGFSVDIAVETSGAYEIDSVTAATHGDFALLDVAPADDYGLWNKVGEANTDWLGIFQKTIWTGSAALKA